MTRHGTLAYYLAAWIIGCPVVALMVWLIGAVQVGAANSSTLFEICFFALMVGAADALLFAFVVRRVMHWMGSRSVAIWTLAGVALGLAMVFLFGTVWNRLQGSAHGVLYLASECLFAGPAAVWSSGWWQAPIEGGGIAAILCLVDRAFHSGAVEAAPARPGAGEAAPTS
jgi:hypothetical protein